MRIKITEARSYQEAGVWVKNPKHSNNPKTEPREVFKAKYSVLYRPEPLPEVLQYAVVQEI